jgi:pimeloyl-ACP methyl ester carboxylesterase
VHDGTPDLPGAEHVRIAAGEVTLHAVRAGAGPPVVLLHGFPEFWWSWRHQLPALAAAGHTAIAVDLRGYNLSDRPRGVRAYGLGKLAADVAAVVRAFGPGPAAVVGHDWGGAVAWSFAARHPELVDRLAVLNSPHPVAFWRGLLRNRQLLRSAYMLALQLPVVPERLLAAGGHRLLRLALRAIRARPVPDDELARYVDAARRAEDLRGPIHYYRAMGRRLLPLAASRRSSGGEPGTRRFAVRAPVLVVWGERDPVLGAHLAAPPAELVPNARVVRLPEAGHTVQLDAPDAVNGLLVEFLRR